MIGMDQGRLIVVGGSGVIGTSVVNTARQSAIPVVATAHRRTTPDTIKFEMISGDLTCSIPDIGNQDTVLILAAYGSPGWIFENQAKARELNVDATVRLVKTCQDRGASVFFMSTDQVFDGRDGGYTEEVSPNPLNLYGRMKVEVEDFLLSLEGNHCVMRTGWNVPGDPDSHCAVKDAYHHLLSGNARMAYDNLINISDINDTARGVVELAKLPDRPKIVHLAACPAVSRTQLCEWIIAESTFGDKMSFEPIRFSELTYSEPRPTNAWLDNGLAVGSLGLTFTPPEKTVRAKVRLLDALQRVN